MDAFFAAVEQRDNPALRGKPVVVGSLPGTRGVVATCSYEARTYGVRSAMAISEAVRRLPPDAVFLKPDGQKYGEVSRQLMNLFSDFSPLVEPVSVDEAFLDMTGSERLFGTPMETARRISMEIESRLNLTASIGIAPNKFLAKLASDIQKPHGITMTPFTEDEICLFLEPFPVERLWGVGAVLQKQLALLGVKTVRQLQLIPESLLIDRFGATGKKLSQIRFGIDLRPVEQCESAHSISREHTFNEDEPSRPIWNDTLRWICDDIARRARKCKVRARTITLTYRTPDFVRRSASVTIENTTDCSEEVFIHISTLAKKSLSGTASLRLIGAGLSNFTESETEQLSLFETAVSSNRENWEKRDRAIDDVLARFGTDSLVRGRFQNKKNGK